MWYLLGNYTVTTQLLNCFASIFISHCFCYWKNRFIVSFNMHKLTPPCCYVNSTTFSSKNLITALYSISLKGEIMMTKA